MLLGIFMVKPRISYVHLQPQLDRIVRVATPTMNRHDVGELVRGVNRVVLALHEQSLWARDRDKRIVLGISSDGVMAHMESLKSLDTQDHMVQLMF